MNNNTHNHQPPHPPADPKNEGTAHNPSPINSGKGTPNPHGDNNTYPQGENNSPNPVHGGKGDNKNPQGCKSAMDREKRRLISNIKKQYKDFNLISPDKSRVDFDKEAEKQYNQGMKLRGKKRWFDAINCFQKALEYHPQHLPSCLEMARIFYILEDKDTSASYYHRVFELNKWVSEAYLFLFEYYMERNQYLKSASFLERALKEPRQQKNYRRILSLLARLYFLGGDYQESREIYRKILNIDVYNTEVYQQLKKIYTEENQPCRMKACEDILILNKQLSTRPTAFIEPFRSWSPLSSDIYDRITHPGQRTFQKFLGWLSPLFKLMEKPAPADILLHSQRVQAQDPLFHLHKNCCHYMNMDPIPLFLYKGKARFHFILSPSEEEEYPYSLIVHHNMVRDCQERELAFLIVNQLCQLKTPFTPLLNLSLSDGTRILLEIAGLMLGLLSIIKSLPLDKAEKIMDKTGKSINVFNKFRDIQKKAGAWTWAGRSSEEVQQMVNKSLALVPDSVQREKDPFYKTLLNQKILKTLLIGFHYTSDRIAYMLTGDLVCATRALIKHLQGIPALERVEKFGLEPYIRDCGNIFLKNRLAQLYFFAVDFDINHPPDGEKEIIRLLKEVKE